MNFNANQNERLSVEEGRIIINNANRLGESKSMSNMTIEVVNVSVATVPTAKGE